MGMTVNCASCGHEESSDNHRGARIGSCPECGGQMQAHTGGKSKGRYRCPVTGWVFTLGMRYSVQLEQPMRLVFVPGWDNYWGERRHRAEPEGQELKYLERAVGLVLGPGCAVDRDFAPPAPDDHHYGHAGVYLVPAPDADPATWFVNERLTYRKCAACPKKVVASDATRMPGQWTPRRDSYWKGRQKIAVTPGPHPAGSYACPDCQPLDEPSR